MSSYKRIAITNRHLCNIPLTAQLEKILPLVDIVILREKDMTEYDYSLLAADVINLCNRYDRQCILHSFINVAEKLNYRKIHLPPGELKRYAVILSDYDIVGASVHSVSEAEEALSLSADYLIASHIFPTKCKAGLPPKGPELIHSIRHITDKPIYALGGIDDSNEHIVIDSGADGACRMSYYMTFNKCI